MSADEVELTPEAEAAVTRALAQAPGIPMPHDVWERLQAALVVEAANRNHAEQYSRVPDPLAPEKAVKDVAETALPVSVSSADVADLTPSEERRLFDEAHYRDDEQA